jgi:omega-6 fatty acid desaturase (delta-12 desaturase)
MAYTTGATKAAIEQAAKVVDNGDKHIDQLGNEFELPTYTMKEIHDAIPAHCFQPSTIRSLAYVARDFLYVSILVYCSTYIQYLPNPITRFLGWVAYSVVQGWVFTGIWILAHECGHGAFSKSIKLNNWVGWLLHSFLLVPYYSWKITHSTHHKNTGNIEKDTAFVPHERESWVKSHCGEKADLAAVELAHLAEDAPLVTFWYCFKHQLFGWPGYLFANLTGQKYEKGFPQFSHFYFGEDSVLFKKEQLPLIIWSDIGVLGQIALLTIAGHFFGSSTIALLYVPPYLWVNHWIGTPPSPSPIAPPQTQN